MEKALTYLKEYTSLIEPVIESVYTEAIAEAAHVSDIAKIAVSRYREFMRGGKKHRGALVKLGYELTQGTIDEEVLKASLAIEVTHAFLLMHDDYMDQDDTRRGEPTVHKQYENDVAQFLDENDKKHYGASMAINVGDIGAYV